MSSRPLLLYVATMIGITTFFASCSNNGGKIERIDLFPVEEGDAYQYIDRTGKIIITPQFSEASLFHEGLALVRGTDSNYRWGYIDKEGKFAIPASYKEATDFHDGIAWVILEGTAPTAIGTNGVSLFTLNDAESTAMFSENMAAFSVHIDPAEYLIQYKEAQLNDAGLPFLEMWGFVNNNGDKVISPKFSKVRVFRDGLCSVSDYDGKWGYIDKSGEYHIRSQFEEAYDFQDGRAAVRMGGKWGVIDRNGKIVINPQFDEIILDGSDYLVKVNGQYGWCDEKGKYTINPQFDDASPFWSGGLAPAYFGGKWGYVDRSGKIDINYQFDDFALPFNSDCALVRNSHKTGIIGTNGNYLATPRFGYLSKAARQFIELHTYKYSTVATDYIDMHAIASALNYRSPGGLGMDMSYGQIMEKLDSSVEVSEAMRIEKHKAISGEATYSLTLRGYPMRLVTIDHSGAYSYQTREMQLDTNARPICFIYSIVLQGRGKGKETMLAKEIGSTLVGYNEVGPALTGGISYTSTINTIIVEPTDDEVKIWIYPPNPDVDPRDPEAQGD